MHKPFTIDQVSWHTGTPGSTESREHIIKRFHVIACFLQERGLSARPLVIDVNDIKDDFAIKSSDLTEEGLALMKASYDKWLQKVDKGMSVEDVSLLENALKRIRTQ